MKKLILFFSIFTAMLVAESSVQAKWGTFTITDNAGEQVKVKHGLFSKKVLVKDRLGDGYEHSRSIFGLTKDTEVGVLGNSAHVHKGLFGFGKTEAHDMLGDSAVSKKNLLFRNTNIDMSGANAALTKIFSPKRPSVPSPSNLPPLPPPDVNVPGQIDPALRIPANSFPNN